MDAAHWIRRLLEAIRVLPNGVKVSPEEMFACSNQPPWCETCAAHHRIGDHRQRKTAAPSDLLPADHQARKATPMCRGLLDYFPLACAEVARLSMAANEQHNPGEPMHWAREKSTDHADCIVRHLVDRGKLDKDGQRHSAKVAWRALALLQLELEGA